MDEFYNERFANKIVSIISKMDNDEAEVFMRLSTYDVLMADIEANRRTLNAREQQVHKQLQASTGRALSSMVSKSAVTDAKDIAALVGAVSKKFDKSERRDAHGRWTVSVSREKGKSKGHVMVGPDFDLTNALASGEKKGNAFSQAWNNHEDLHASTNKRTYDRIAAGAEALGGIGGPKAQAATQVAGFFGRYGPEAEKVVGPHLRRTAYRYRGTERTPDGELIRSANEVSRAVMRNEESEELTPAMRTFASQQAATKYLMGRLPTKGLSGLQQASGKIPPSEGVIINADGKIIHQAVGYADDHYLPFNLKNLKGLQGGAYVRSRSQGGLTTEDIYTGLVSGARSVTVVSRSGVFTMNFEDDFRGGRRYNDKAAAMVGRYAKTLDAVKSETVDRRPLSPEERADIREEVEKEVEDYGMAPGEVEDLIKEREREYKMRPTLTKDELAEIEMRAQKDNMDDPRKYRIARSELISAAMDAKAERNYKLDGEGYGVAMEALKEQFPYYIANVRAVHRKNAVADNPFTAENDKGYVKPRYIRPEGAKEGYFDQTINGRKKISADRLNYANWPTNPENKHQHSVARSEDGEKDSEGSPKVAPALEMREKIARGKLRADGDESLKKLAQLYASAIKAEELPDVVRHAAGEGFQQIADNPAKREELMNELSDLHERAKGSVSDAVHDKAESLFVAVRASRSGTHFSVDRAAENPGIPFEFDIEGGKKVAYSGYAKEHDILPEWRKQVAKLVGPDRGMAPGQLSQEELGKQAAGFGYMGHALKNGLDSNFAEYAAARGVSEHAIAHAVQASRQGHGEEESKRSLEVSEALHRLRRLQYNLDRQERRHEKSMPDTPKAKVEPQSLSSTRSSVTVDDLMGKAQSEFRNAAKTAAAARPDMAEVYNVIGRAIGNLKIGALEKDMFERDVEDALSSIPRKDADVVKAHLKSYDLYDN